MYEHVVVPGIAQRFILLVELVRGFPVHAFLLDIAAASIEIIKDSLANSPLFSKQPILPWLILRSVRQFVAMTAGKSRY